MPSRPPNFRTTHRVTGTIALDALEVYSTAIEFLAQTCTGGWNEPALPLPIPLPFRSSLDSPIQITIARTRAEQERRVRYSHVFFALQEAITIMSSRASMVLEEFYAMNVLMYIDDIPVGYVRVSEVSPLSHLTLKSTSGTIDSSSVNNDHHSNKNENNSITTTTTTTTAYEHIYLDPSHRFAIPYTITPPIILPSELFTSIIEAIIIATHDDPALPFTALDAVSATGKTALHINSVTASSSSSIIPVPTAGIGTGTGITVIRSLLVSIARLIIGMRKFGSLEFAYERFGGGKVGERVREFEGWFLGV
ncbi:MAG: hypothetical protein Q9169_004398 [Polycauliona sp. 2 TL-2023]